MKIVPNLIFGTKRLRGRNIVGTIWPRCLDRSSGNPRM